MAGKRKRRDTAINALRDGLNKIIAGADPARVLAPELTSLAAAVIDFAASSSGDDLDARYVLGWWHWLRYLALPPVENQPDLHAAIELLEPLAAVPNAVPPQLAAYFAQPAMHELAITLALAYERSGDLTTLDRAIVLFQQIADTIPDDYPDRGGHLSNLGNALRSRFEHTGDLAVLDEAVQNYKLAVEATRSDNPNRSQFLSNLAAALRLRFDRTADLTVLVEAVQTYKLATEATPSDNPNRCTYLSNLSNALGNRFDCTGELAVLDDAVAVARQAVAESPDNHRNRGMYLSNLATALGRQFDRTSDLAVLNDAIAVARQAVAVTRDDHPNRSAYLSNLANALRRRFEHTREPAVLNQARVSFADALLAALSPVDIRLQAARGAIETDLLAGDVDHALAMAELAVSLLSLVAPRRLYRSDRQHRITSIAGLASTVATAALIAGQSDRAVELLEQTRGLLVAETLDTRGDLSALQQHAPDLSAEFSTLRERLHDLDHTSAPAESAATLEIDHQRRIRRDQILRDWHRLLSHIRRIPSLSGFLLPPPIQQLRHAAAHGPIVYVVIHALASNAIILTNHREHPTQAIPLPALAREVAYDRANQLRDAYTTATDPNSPALRQIAAQAQVMRVLRWLWDTITKPVLDHLGYTATPPDGQPWPRIYWCPVDIATFLPLHAAGNHPGVNHTSSDTHDTVIDRVVSSYTPSTRALLHTLNRRPPTGTNRALIIAVPDAPNAPPLLGVNLEATELTQLIPTATTLPSHGGEATHDTVLAALPAYEVAHFACHGLADWGDPTSSRLILHDHRTHPLTVADIARLHLTNAHLAYLSACSTTDTNPKHVDEATHLTAAFQLAGYSSVIGTLWPINDHAATTITRHVYNHLTHHGASPPQPHLAAHALHHATRHHRDTHPNQPTQWSAHIHTGH